MKILIQNTRNRENKRARGNVLKVIDQGFLRNNNKRKKESRRPRPSTHPPKKHRHCQKYFLVKQILVNDNLRV